MGGGFFPPPTKKNLTFKEIIIIFIYENDRLLQLKLICFKTFTTTKKKEKFTFGMIPKGIIQCLIKDMPM